MLFCLLPINLSFWGIWAKSTNIVIIFFQSRKVLSKTKYSIKYSILKPDESVVWHNFKTSLKYTFPCKLLGLVLLGFIIDKLNETGQEITESSQILNKCATFYKALYKSTDPKTKDIQNYLDGINLESKLSDDDSKQLEGI